MTAKTDDITLFSPVRRILIVDDTPSIHEDIKQILEPRPDDPLAPLEAELFGDSAKPPNGQPPGVRFELVSAFQGQQAVTIVEEAIAAGRPFSLAFVDVRMPPGWDGIETIERIHRVDPRMQIVICSAYSDYSWKSIHGRLGVTDWLLILRKPFEHAEIEQLASALAEKWQLGYQASLNTETLEGLVQRYAQQYQDANAELAKRNASLMELNERISQEIRARELADERIRHIAFHDVLTNLPNRAYFMERLQECIDRSNRQCGYRFAVLFGDIDNFKLVNDSLGHRSGDQLLTQIASAMLAVMSTLTASIRPSHDTVARLGGDEFVVLLEDIDSFDKVMSIAQRIQQAVATPLDVGQRQIVPSISIGAAISQAKCDDVIDIMRDADTALYHAKAQGKGRVAMFDNAMRSRVLERADLEADLQHAILNHEFTVYYQPIVSLVTGKLRCLEALVRWQHPRRGLLPPDDFLPTAEQCNLMETIGEEVLDEVIGQLADWHARFAVARNLPVSVNLSAGQLVGSRLFEHIDRCLLRYGVEPSALKIELTENSAIRNLDLSRSVIDGLVSRGIEVYLDDFGTGYSSLSTLHTFPFAAIKLDKSFVDNLETDVECETTVRAMVMITENRNIALIAEGIESIEQVAVLRDLDCEFGQGYYFSRPVPAAALDSLLESGASYCVQAAPIPVAST